MNLDVFVLRRGRYQVAKQEYSYARRAQSTVRSLQWKDMCIISADSADDAANFAKKIIAGIDADSWVVEGRGCFCGQIAEVGSE